MALTQVSTNLLPQRRREHRENLDFAGRIKQRGSTRSFSNGGSAALDPPYVVTLCSLCLCGSLF